MWTECPRLLDEPAKILGMEVGDYGLLMAVPLLCRPFFSAPVCMGVGALAAWAVTMAKRSRPHGALPHMLHALELLPWPGVLRPAPVRYTPWPAQPDVLGMSLWRQLISYA